jgi:hypothetical protein
MRRVWRVNLENARAVTAAIIDEFAFQDEQQFPAGMMVTGGPGTRFIANDGSRRAVSRSL